MSFAATRRALAARYGTPEKARLDPLAELILTILSQNTTDANRDRAWAALRARYPEWERVRDAPRRELEETIRPAGLVTGKAAAIQGALDRLYREVGRLSLDHLAAMGDEEALRYLRSFRGVGLKTAACVLCFALGRAVMPVDTHVHRVARRLGWADERADAAATHERLNRTVPPELRFALHVYLIALGRDVCTAGRPACSDCVLADRCPRVGVGRTDRPAEL